MLRQLIRAGHIQQGESTTERVRTAEDFKGCLSGLYKRGLLDTEMVHANNKKLMMVYLTAAGLSFLQRYEADRKIVVKSSDGDSK